MGFDPFPIKRSKRRWKILISEAIKKRPPTGERLGYAKKVTYFSLKQSCPVGGAGCAMMMMLAGE